MTIAGTKKYFWAGWTRRKITIALIAMTAGTIRFMPLSAITMKARPPF
jgi:hypothetical protein